MSTSYNQDALNRAWDHLEGWHVNEGVRAIAAQTGSTTGIADEIYFGFDDKDQTVPVDHQSRFLIASPTKPFVATAIMMLVEQGLLRVSDLISRFIPAFGEGAKSQIRIAHLLTHTSGLPDMLPNNIELRKRHAPLSEYQSFVNDVDLVYAPGTRVYYQSMGILTLSSIIELVTGTSTPEFLANRIFNPLGMQQTSLGLTQEQLNAERPSVSSMVEQQEGHDQWGWNSDYWRKLGAPWGGLISTASDLGLFCRHLLSVHQGAHGIIYPSTLRAMTTNQLRSFPKLRQGSADAVPWGYGWQLNWPNHPRGLGSILPAEAYGHWGATGTLVWIDPVCEAYGVVLTNEPMEMENRRQINFANLCRLAWD